MRTFTLAMAGIAAGLSVNAFAGSPKFGIPDEPRLFRGHYTYAPHTMMEQRGVPVSIPRRFEFTFLDSEYSARSSSGLAPDPEAIVREYSKADVDNARARAAALAFNENISVKEAERRLLAQLPSRAIDCRVVARNMVLALVEHDMKEVVYPNNVHSHQYYRYSDECEERGLRGESSASSKKNCVKGSLDRAIVARQLGRIAIERDRTIPSGDINPHFTCQAGAVNGETVGCGDLTVRYNPVPAVSGPFKGQKALVYDERVCQRLTTAATSRDEAQMSRLACKNMLELERCGLRFTAKADGDRAGYPSTQGLADKLRQLRDDEIRSRERGDFIQRRSSPKVEVEEDEEIGGWASPPASEFRGASQPAS